jgi:hypothetical protein
MDKILQSIGKIPLLDSDDSEQLQDSLIQKQTQKRILADGTYATESAYSAVSSTEAAVKCPIRSIINLI